MVEGVAGLDKWVTLHCLLVSHLPCSHKGEGLVAVDEAPVETQQVLGCCHSLLMLEDELVGDPLEKASLTSLNWELTKSK